MKPLAIVLLFVPSAALAQQKPVTRVAISIESREHTLARVNYESVKGQFEDSKKEYEEKLSGEPTYNGESRCKPFPVEHPVTMYSAKEHMIGCGYEAMKARYIMERLAEALEVDAMQLDHVDECLATYRATIDKKISDQTTREVEQIKFCQAAHLFPPPSK